MAKNNNKKNGSTVRRNQPIQVKPKIPSYDKYQRFTRMPEDNNNGIKYGTIIVIAVLAGLAALVSPLGIAVTDQFNYTGQSAADVWWILASIAVILGTFLGFADWYSRGKY